MGRRYAANSRRRKQMFFIYMSKNWMAMAAPEFLRVFCNFCAKKCKDLILLDVEGRTGEASKGECDKVKEIVKMLQMFSNIEPCKSNELPNKICLKCLDELKRCYAFYSKIREARQVLQCVLNERRTVGSKLPLLMPKPVQLDTETIAIAKKVVCSKPKRRYPCQECLQIFSSSRLLTVHQKSHENSNVCRFCGYFFLELKVLEDHIETIHPDSTYECLTCSRTFVSRNLMFKHLKTMHGTNDRTYFCAECKDLPSNRFPNSSQLKEHIKRVHPMSPNITAEEKPVLNDFEFHTEMNEEFLDDMDEEFLDEFLLNHDRTSFCWDDLSLTPFDEEFKPLSPNTNIENNRFKCPRCEQMFTTQQDMKLHLAQRHDEFVLICNVCGSAFNRTTDLKQHRKVHILENTSDGSSQSSKSLNQDATITRTHCCYLCDKTFKTLPGLKYHLKIHAGTKPFICPYCSKKFTANINLNAHIRIVHAEIKTNVCSLCDRRFATIDHLKKHVMSVHQKERNHLCSTCGKSFSQISHLKQHAFIHMPNLKPFICDACGLGFTKKIELKKHSNKMHADDMVGQ